MLVLAVVSSSQDQQITGLSTLTPWVHACMPTCLRAQGTGGRCGGGRAPRACGGEAKQQAVWKAEAMLLQRGVESVLFQGRKLSGETNAEKVERFAREMAREHARRKKQQQQQQMGPCLPVVAAAASGAAAPPNNDKQPPPPLPTTTTANAAAKKKHTPATSRLDGGGTR